MSDVIGVNLVKQESSQLAHLLEGGSLYQNIRQCKHAELVSLSRA